VIEASVAWNYTTVLNIAFLSLAAVLVWLYFRFGEGLRMLRMMDAPTEPGHHGHHCDVQHAPDSPQPAQ
jgi:hypothetical protein